jgi:hypothetical protein
VSATIASGEDFSGTDCNTRGGALGCGMEIKLHPIFSPTSSAFFSAYAWASSRVSNPWGTTGKHPVIPERVVPLLILNEPTVRSSLMVVFLENQVIAVTALGEVSMLVRCPIHGPELSMLRKGGQPAVAPWRR